MSNNLNFAIKVAACAVLVIMFWAACAGIGYRILPKPSAGDDGPASWRQPGIAACVGLGALLLLGGFGVLLGIPWWLFVPPFLVVGLVLAMLELRGYASRHASVARSALILGAIGVAAFCLVAVVEAPLGLRFPLNICDDWRAYLPYAHRLLDTYGLEEPWSSRRVQSLGGFDLLRAMPVAVFGDVGIGVAETVIASVFLAGLFVANGVRSSWARLLSIGFILAIPLFWVPRTNTTGVLMGAPLLVAAYAATAEMRSALRAGNRGTAARWAAAAGLVVAALMSVRPNLGLAGATVLALGALSVRGTKLIARVQVLGASAASALVAFIPWSVAMWRTAGTPLYPLFPGNLSPEATERQDIKDLAQLAEHTFDLVHAGPYLWVMLGALVVALVGRKFLPDSTLVAIAAIATGAVTVAFALNTPWVTPDAFMRYIAPMGGALGVFLLCEAMRGADALPKREPAGRPRWLVPTLGVVAGVGLAGLAFSTVGHEGVSFDHGARLVLRAARNELVSPPGHEVAPPALRNDFRRALRGVDPDRTIAAVDRPYLIDYSRYDVPNLDAPGFMTPDGRGFPFFAGPGAKISRLRRAGYDTLIATDPPFDACFTPVRIEAAALDRPFDRNTYDRFLDWDYDIQKIAERAPSAVRRFGPLLVIDLRRAQRDLPAAATGA